MINIIYNWLVERSGTDGEDVISGLVFGLASGLVFGLASGLVFGLVFVLASGLVFGLVYGLANLSLLIPTDIVSMIAFIVLVFILAEILFAFNKKQKKVSWGRVILLKADSVFSSLLIIINALFLLKISRSISITVTKSEVITASVVIGALMVTAAVLYLWLWMNKKVIEK